MPIYFESIPLIPTFFDLNVPSLSGSKIKLSADRDELLSLINSSRLSSGLSSLSLDDNLNKLAQSHADDMVNNDFFAHVNSAGLTPGDRAKKAGIKSTVSENLARAVSLEYAHEGLLVSALHRQNILSADNSKVGIGLSKDSNGYIYVVEEFLSSGTKRTKSAADISDELLTYINAGRYSAELNVLTVNAQLKNVAGLWSTKMADYGFTGFSAPSGSLDELIIGNGLFEDLDAFVFDGSSLSSLKNSVGSETDVLTGEISEIGLDVKFSEKDGTYKSTILYR